MSAAPAATATHSNSASAASTSAHASRIPRGGLATEFNPARRLAKFTAPTVWHEFTPLAQQTKAVNLGQGFPGWSPPDFVKQAAANAVQEVNQDFHVNQYARSAGHMALVNNLASSYAAALGRKIDPLTEIVVTDGASEALCTAILGLLNPGDEMVTLEPAFDIYIAQAEMVEAVLKTVPYRLSESTDVEGEKQWTIDLSELRRAFSDKTRLFLLNTPHNPTGKVWSEAELHGLRDILADFPNVTVVADEVYEHMVYAPRQHTSIASLDGMWDRTLTISSAGKTFSTTGWKVGWAIGPAHLVRAAAVCHQWLAFSVCTPMQQAIADSLTRAKAEYDGHATYYAWLNDMYRQKRAFMCDALRAAGIEPIVPEGGFFIVGDTSRIQLPEPYASDKSVTRDWSLCRWLTKEIGVAAIPPSSFYADETKHLAANTARFAFCKPDEVLQEAAKRLLKCKEFLKQ